MKYMIHYVRERERERERERQAGRQTDRERGRERETDRQTEALLETVWYASCVFYVIPRYSLKMKYRYLWKRDQAEVTLQF